MTPRHITSRSAPDHPGLTPLTPDAVGHDVWSRIEQDLAETAERHRRWVEDGRVGPWTVHPSADQA